MVTHRIDPTSTIIITLFFMLFAGVPGYVFYKSYTMYSLKNLPVVTLEEIQNTPSGVNLSGLLVLDSHKKVESGQKLASFFVHPQVWRFRRFDQEIKPVNLFDGSVVF